jgi:hypothetical protein
MTRKPDQAESPCDQDRTLGVVAGLFAGGADESARGTRLFATPNDQEICLVSGGSVCELPRNQAERPALVVPGLPGRDVVSRSGIGSADLIMK